MSGLAHFADSSRTSPEVQGRRRAMVARYEPGTPEKPNPFENEKRYAHWLAQAREALKAAAPYYAPKLHAIAYAPMQTPEAKAARRDPREIMLDELMEMSRRGELAVDITKRKPEPPVIERQPARKPPEDDDADGVAARGGRSPQYAVEFLKRGKACPASLTSPSKSTIWRRQPSFMKRCSAFAKPARCGLVDVPPKLLAKVEATDASAMISRVLI